MVPILRYCNSRHVALLNVICVRNSCTDEPNTKPFVKDCLKVADEEKKIPDEPTTCCMSGCNNCVWIEYADKLSEYYKDGGERAIQEINEKISDPNIKSFIMFQIRMGQTK